MTDEEKDNLYIVFPLHNRLESTRRFMESLRDQTYQDYQVVICDDGSTDGTGEYLAREHPDAVVIQGSGQLWWTAGINKCVQYVLDHCGENDYILTLNNDVALPSNYLEQKMHRGAEVPGQVIGSLCVYAHDRNTIETSGYIMNFAKCEAMRLTRPGEQLTNGHKGMVEVTHLPGKGVLVPADVYRQVGLYDEKSLPQYHADTDFTLRAHKAGIKVFLDFDSTVYSDINTNNMVQPTQNITIKGILKTYNGPYSMNNYRINSYFARKHFPDHWRKYLLKKYFRIIGGQAKRYFASRVTSMFNRS